MKIDWKYVATTRGYKSLKAAYITTVQNGRNFKNKKELLNDFNKIISRAKYHANLYDITIDKVLDAWEDKRDYNWRSFYSDHNNKLFKKILNIKLHPQGVKGYKKYLKRWAMHNKSNIKKHICEYIQRKHKNNLSEKRKKKPRWTTEYKKRKAKYGY
jgi:hypothetical protein